MVTGNGTVMHRFIRSVLGINAWKQPAQGDLSCKADSLQTLVHLMGGLKLT